MRLYSWVLGLGLQHTSWRDTVQPTAPVILVYSGFVVLAVNSERGEERFNQQEAEGSSSTGGTALPIGKGWFRYHTP